jgi:SAM-dependent methyltransferase
LEFSSSAARAARAEGLRVSTGAFPASMPEGQFDIVTMWDVLAGLTDLHGAIQAVTEILAPGGRLIVTVPCVSSRTARSLGRYWPLWIPPVNLHYFSHSSIERLMTEHGLSVVSCSTEPKRVAVEFLIRKALRTVGLRGLEFISKGVPRRWTINLNLGDILTVQAEKRKGSG